MGRKESRRDKQLDRKLLVAAAVLNLVASMVGLATKIIEWLTQR